MFNTLGFRLDFTILDEMDFYRGEDCDLVLTDRKTFKCFRYVKEEMALYDVTSNDWYCLFSPLRIFNDDKEVYVAYL